MDEYTERSNATIAYRLLEALKELGVIDETTYYDLRFPSEDQLTAAEEQMK